MSKTYKFQTAQYRTKLWYLEYLIFAKRNNLLENLEYLKPGDFLTRGDVAQLVFNFEKYADLAK
ncbi:hypothetical protein LR002_03085 [Candidatus Gracilibacteria bacterium]|nr:hypothetical protein [Candidatus Gracilibacteria bacterium]